MLITSLCFFACQATGNFEPNQTEPRAIANHRAWDPCFIKPLQASRQLSSLKILFGI